jgi:hypothetical protein
VRHTQFGEGDYLQSEAAVRELLYEAGAHNLPPPMSAHAIMPSAGVATPETYLGSDRAQGFVEPPKKGVHFYQGVSGRLGPDAFALHGTWRVGSQSASPVSAGALIRAHFQAAHVYLVMTSAGNAARQVRVLLDGHPITARSAGSDVRGATVTVRGQRLYSLVSLRSAQSHELTLKVPPGVSAYDFTFG